MKLAVVLFNLGGPDSPEAVEPFLRNLFSDPAVIPLPGLLRKPLAHFVARQRAPFAREIYSKIGGHSPILEETEAQARALEQALAALGNEARAFIAMRCWKPFSDETVQAIKAWAPEHIVLLPLYPQFSTTTTGSSISDWYRAAAQAQISTPTSRICCYPDSDGFVRAIASLVRDAYTQAKPDLRYRLLLSAHGLPERTIAQGDPYRWQVESTVREVVKRLTLDDLDWVGCYQSRVGPLKWIGPATDDEIKKAGSEGKGVILAPIAFVSEHSETLVELDMEYKTLAQASGVRDYIRVPTVRARPDFIAGLASLVIKSVQNQTAVTSGAGRICPREFSKCGFA